MNTSIHESETIVNRLKEHHLYDQFNAQVIRHLATILVTVFSTGYHGKTVDIAEHSDCHRTTIGYFLNHGKWDDHLLEMIIKQVVINIIYEESKSTGKPVLCMIDDTVTSKSKPYSGVKQPIEGAGFHYSHLKGKQDYGHQAIAVMLSCNGITLNYTIMMYDKSVSKIDLVCGIADELPAAPNISYLLCDSWYACGKVMDAFVKCGYYTVGAVKTNRIVYFKGIRISIRQLAQKLKEGHCDELFHLVTVKEQKYYVYRYEGNLNGVENAAVLLTFPVNSLYHPKALRAFICTDASLSDEQILALYVQRWQIEVFFRESKRRLAIEQYQIRSAKGIQRFWLIASLAHLLACCASPSFNFSEGYSLIAYQVRCDQITAIFDFARSGGELSVLLDMLL